MTHGETGSGVGRDSKVPVGAAPTVLGAGCTFEGLLSFRGAARLEGRLVGEVVAEGRLEVGPEARVRARIQVDELIVAGEVEGDIDVRARLQIESTGRILGDVSAPRLAVAEGGRLQGRCTTPRSGVSPAPPGTAREQPVQRAAARARSTGSG